MKSPSEPGRIHSSNFVECHTVLDRNFDRNTDKLQRTITDVSEQDPALGATGRTTTDCHGQSMPYPPFGTHRTALKMLSYHFHKLLYNFSPQSRSQCRE